MKRIVIALSVFIICPACAPATVTLKSGVGDVTFNHKIHGEKTDCKTCHGGGILSKPALGSEEQAHNLCLNCHKEKKAGPTECSDCHKKK